MPANPNPTRETTLLLIRHAETLANASLLLAGWTDADLSPSGERQVEVLAGHVALAHRDLAALYASPLVRARRTAEAIGALTGHAPIYLEDLREMHFGDLEGLTFDELQTSYSDLLVGNEDAGQPEFAWPGGESHVGFRARALAALNEIATRHVGGSVAVVTHGGVVTAFMTALHGEPMAAWRRWQVPNASLTEVAWDPWQQAGRLVRHGDASYLAEAREDETGRQAAG